MSAMPAIYAFANIINFALTYGNEYTLIFISDDCVQNLYSNNGSASSFLNKEQTNIASFPSNLL